MLDFFLQVFFESPSFYFFTQIMLFKGFLHRVSCHHLECMWSVMNAVDSEAVVQGEARGSGGEQGELQPFAGRLRRAGLSHQTVRSQLLHEDVTTLLLQLQVARRRQGLLSHCQHLLMKKVN